MREDGRGTGETEKAGWKDNEERRRRKWKNRRRMQRNMMR